MGKILIKTLPKLMCCYFLYSLDNFCQKIICTIKKSENKSFVHDSYVEKSQQEKYLSESLESTVNSTKQSGEDCIPNLCIHEIYL